MNVQRVPGTLTIALLLLVAAALAACDAATAGVPGTSGPAGTSSPTTGPVLHAEFQVDLLNATSDAVTISINDESGSVVSATSGGPADGASVEPGELVIVNDDPRTLRLTWTGGPCASASFLAVGRSGRDFLLVQPDCGGDAIAFDRILVLRFDRPIEANQVVAVLAAGPDTTDW